MSPESVHLHGGCYIIMKLIERLESLLNIGTINVNISIILILILILIPGRLPIKIVTNISELPSKLPENEKSKQGNSYTNTNTNINTNNNQDSETALLQTITSFDSHALIVNELKDMLCYVRYSHYYDYHSNYLYHHSEY